MVSAEYQIWLKKAKLNQKRKKLPKGQINLQELEGGPSSGSMQFEELVAIGIMIKVK